MRLQYLERGKSFDWAQVSIGPAGSGLDLSHIDRFLKT
jgi:hypothetical protein